MALTNAEKVRRYRERLKQKEKLSSQSADEVFKRPFFEAYNEDANVVTLDIIFDAMGLDWLEFADDSGPKPRTENVEQSDLDEFTNSHGRAEFMVSCLLDAAGVLAGIVHDYKVEEIDRRIAEIEDSDLTDPAVKKQALATIAKLTRYRDELSKQVRWTLPQWKVKGV